MKKISKIAASAGLLVLLGASSAALASPTGVYVDVMGGGDYLAAANLDSMQFPFVSDGEGGTTTENAVPSYSNKFGYTGRTAFGYFFNQDPLSSWAFGLEAGYNYLSPVDSSTTKSFVDGGGDNYNVKGSLKTKAWSSDVDFVISEDISQSVSLLYKFGVAYESMTRSFTATQLSGEQPNAFDSKLNSDVSGFGGLVGIGMQYNFNKNFGLRAEVDGMKGGKDIGYAQGLVGLVYQF